jgi:hypothetical protein
MFDEKGLHYMIQTVIETINIVMQVAKYQIP